MAKIYPVYTTLGPNPKTICHELDEAVFTYPFFNAGTPVARIDPAIKYHLDSIVPSREIDQLKLKGLIFHTSHCGSTLLSRMLGQLRKVRVVNEPEAINGLLLSKLLYDIEDGEIICQLKRIISLYQQKTSPDEYLIIKLTSWNVYMIQLFQQAYPGLRWIFLDRETSTLTKSLLTASGGFIDWWDHPVDILRKHFVDPKLEIRNKEEYLVEIIRGHRMYAHNHKSDHSLFLEYPYFIETYEEILSHFDFKATVSELQNSKEMLNYDSKSMNKQVWKNVFKRNPTEMLEKRIGLLKKRDTQ